MKWRIWLRLEYVEIESERSINEMQGQTFIETLNFHSWKPLSLSYSMSVLILLIPALIACMPESNNCLIYPHWVG